MVEFHFLDPIQNTLKISIKLIPVCFIACCYPPLGELFHVLKVSGLSNNNLNFLTNTKYASKSIKLNLSTIKAERISFPFKVSK